MTQYHVIPEWHTPAIFSEIRGILEANRSYIESDYGTQFNTRFADYTFAGAIRQRHRTLLRELTYQNLTVAQAYDQLAEQLARPNFTVVLPGNELWGAHRERIAGWINDTAPETAGGRPIANLSAYHRAGMWRRKAVTQLPPSNPMVRAGMFRVDQIANVLSMAEWVRQDDNMWNTSTRNPTAHVRNWHILEAR